jgi:hypothetical protein
MLAAGCMMRIEEMQVNSQVISSKALASSKHREMDYRKCFPREESRGSILTVLHSIGSHSAAFSPHSPSLRVSPSGPHLFARRRQSLVYKWWRRRLLA